MGSGNRFNYAVVFAVALGSFTFGFNNAIIAPVLGLPSFLQYFNLEPGQSESSLSTRIVGAQSGLFFGGGLIGALSNGYLADKVGRIRNLQITASVCVIAAILQGASVHIAMLLVARFLSGFGSGLICAAVPLYQSEISPARRRGRMVGAHGTLLCVGYGCAGWSGYGCYFEKDPNIQWRLLLCLQLIAPAFLLMATLWLPESPRWLIAQGKDSQGLRILKKLHHKEEDPRDIFAREEFMQIEQQLELESTQARTLWAMVKVPSARRRLITGFLIQALAQSTGVQVLNIYSVLLYNTLGLTGSKPLLVYACYASQAAIFNYLSSLILDRVGRARLFQIGVCGLLTCLTIFTALVGKFGGTDNKVACGTAIAFQFFFSAIYGTCIDANTYVYCTEIFPMHMRATGISVAVAGWLGMAIVWTELASTAFSSIGWKYLLVFVASTAAMLPLAFFCLPETKGLSLEEIGQLFGDEVALDLTHMTVAERNAFDERLDKVEEKMAGNDVQMVEDVAKKAV